MVLADKGLVAGPAAEPAGAVVAAEAFPVAPAAEAAGGSPVAVEAGGSPVAVEAEPPGVAAAMAALVEAKALPNLNSRFSGPARYPSNRPS